MNDGMKGPELVRDDALTTALRELYAPPMGEAYWTALEGRIVAALDGEEPLYGLPERWLRRGLVAAAAALLIAGAVLWRTQAATNRTMAYENVQEVEGLGSALAQREPISADQATLRKLTGQQ